MKKAALAAGDLHRYRTGLGVRAKIIWMVTLLVLLAGGWITWRADAIAVNIMKQQLAMRGVSIARDVAARSVDSVLTYNLYDLYRLIQDTLENNEDIVYIFVQDRYGEVLVHSFPGQQVPLNLQKFNNVFSGDRYRLASFQSEAGVVHDIAVPILGETGGTVRLGMGEEGLRHFTRQMLVELNITIATAFLLAIGVAYSFASLIVVPLRHLITGTRAIADGNFGVRVPAWTRDEVGQLAGAFNMMAAKLEQYREESRIAQSELAHKEKMLIQLVERLIDAQENERKRIARELHDETGQLLTAMKLGLKVLSDSEDLEQIRTVTAELREILGLTLDEVSALARDLRPSVLDDMGLHTALARYVEKCSHWMGRQVKYSGTGLEHCRFPFYLETAVYRIVQEALTNVRKYAMARTVSVSVDYDGSLLTAVIKDDGVGFLVEEVLGENSYRPGLGLFGMQERAALVGGTLSIESAPRKGTVITLKVPWRGDDTNAKRTDQSGVGR